MSTDHSPLPDSTEGLVSSPHDGQRAKRRVRRVIEWLLILTISLFAAIGLRTYVFQTFSIPSGSMEPTLQIGDRILVSKLSVTWGTIHRGDILVFRTPPGERHDCAGAPVNDLVKRVIGLPGDRLWNDVSEIWVNGHPLAQPWPHSSIGGKPIASVVSPLVVPPHSYYMMGDNEYQSCDSRYWGPISQSLIVGKVVMRIWPPSRITFL